MAALKKMAAPNAAVIRDGAWPPVERWERLRARQVEGERIVLGLRLAEGVPRRADAQALLERPVDAGDRQGREVLALSRAEPAVEAAAAAIGEFSAGPAPVPLDAEDFRIGVGVSAVMASVAALAVLMRLKRERAPVEVDHQPAARFQAFADAGQHLLRIVVMMI